MAEEVLVVFVIALIFCGEYYFGIIGAFQSQSSFRGATHPRQQHDEHQIVRDTLNLVTQQAQLHNEKGNLKLPQTNNLLPIDAQVQHDSRKNQSKVKNVKSMTPLRMKRTCHSVCHGKQIWTSGGLVIQTGSYRQRTMSISASVQ